MATPSLPALTVCYFSRLHGGFQKLWGILIHPMQCIYYNFVFLFPIPIIIACIQLLPPATKLGQACVFTGVCDSVHRRGVPGCWGACVVAGGCAWLLGRVCIVAWGHAWLPGDVRGCWGGYMVTSWACMVAGDMHGCQGGLHGCWGHVWLPGGMCGCWG